MKKLLIIALTTLVVTACSQPKNIYFNGSEGSNSGIKYNPTSEKLSLN
ncbi:lipoprotein [Haemophilus paracuniculus]|nr:lipoprotein [Haemophilus paracuniculus]